MINDIKEKQLWSTALEVIALLPTKGQVRGKDPGSVHASWTELCYLNRVQCGNHPHAKSVCHVTAFLQGFSKQTCMLNTRFIPTFPWVLEPSLEGLGGQQGMQQNALGEIKSVCFCSTPGPLLHVKFGHLLHWNSKRRVTNFCISPRALKLFGL